MWITSAWINNSSPLCTSAWRNCNNYRNLDYVGKIAQKWAEVEWCNLVSVPHPRRGHLRSTDTRRVVLQANWNRYSSPFLCPPSSLVRTTTITAAVVAQVSDSFIYPWGLWMNLNCPSVYGLINEMVAIMKRLVVPWLICMAWANI